MPSNTFPTGTPLAILLAALGAPSEPVYTFVDDSTGQPTHILSGRLAAALVRSSAVPIRCVMDDSLIASLEKGLLGVEEAHALKLPEEALDAPCIVGQWDGAHIMIDGAHRLWRLWQRGDREFNAYYVPEKAWRLFVIDDIGGDGSFWSDFNRTAKVR
jgi:hypothetical protein